MQTPSQERLMQLGYLFPVATGIQADLNAVFRGSVCDHNCTTEVGGYNCPDAFTLNKGKKAKFASAKTIVNRVLMARQGATQARQMWFQGRAFQKYAGDFQISSLLQTQIGEILQYHPTEVNLFGGNPEMHPGLFEIIAALKEQGLRVNLTTTGRKFSNDGFAKQFASNPTHVLALSLDDVTPKELERLLTIPLQDMKAEWKKIPPTHGQQQKVVEGLYAARLAMQEQWSCAVLFNMVLHNGNMNHVPLIIQLVAKHLPKTLVNPYPAQDSFFGGKGNLFSDEAVREFGKLVSFFIEETKNGNPNLTKRLHYWLVMQAIFDNCTLEFPQAIGKMMAGHHVWTCYKGEGTGMYVQIGQGNPNFAQIGQQASEPGGYVGCYWNPNTVTMPVEFTVSDMITNHLLGGNKHLSLLSSDPCPGCNMPRLEFDGPNTECGLNDGLRERYLELRNQHMGF